MGGFYDIESEACVVNNNTFRDRMVFIALE